jgi:hypothetical protein
MGFFPVPKNATARYLFEKSATYFDGDLVPRRAHALLPHAKLVSCVTICEVWLMQRLVMNCSECGSESATQKMND